MIDPGYAQAYTAAKAVQHLLELRETLVRFDENLKAYWLLKQAPMICLDHPEYAAALDAQYAMVKHVLPAEELREEDRGTDPYEAYYRSNPHELRFEQQYGAEVSEAHRLHRVQYLLDWLRGYDLDIHDGVAHPVVEKQIHVLDLSANDGFMAARLSLNGYRCDCLDLHPGNCEIARERKATYPLIGRVEQGALEDDAIAWRLGTPGEFGGAYDAVVLFETIEHVRNPREALNNMRRFCGPEGRLFVSTPNGAVECGNLPNWHVIESKGHVRIFRPDDLRSLLEQVGEVEDMQLGPDGVLVARVKPA